MEREPLLPEWLPAWILISIVLATGLATAGWLGRIRERP